MGFGTAGVKLEFNILRSKVQYAGVNNVRENHPSQTASFAIGFINVVVFVSAVLLMRGSGREIDSQPSNVAGRRLTVLIFIYVLMY